MLRLIKRLVRRRPRTLSSADAYAKWAASYPPTAHNALMAAEERAMRALMPAVTGKIVLDLACGTGRYGMIALEAGAHRVIGLDTSREMLRRNQLAWRALASSEALPLASASVEVIVCGLALGHLPALMPSMHEMGRVLKAGGVALMSDVHPHLFAHGAQRTFAAADGTIYAVEHHPHSIADYVHTADSAGLELAEMREVPVADGDKPAAVVFRFWRR